MVKVWDQDVCFSVVSSLNPVVANMMATGDLHDH
jgi:hypothetical protein